MSNFTKVVTPRIENASNFTDEGKVCRRFRWQVEIEVDETWVMDGFDLTAGRLQDMVLSDLFLARSDEVRCRILRVPDPKIIREAQGYDS